ncbi:MAG: type III pantothenate kinase [Gammaproteobacteria bacterium]|jgi:type III pantothenate kinase|nr:type III pantothenate kinase [Gammaproteobacteria bacterium]
MTLLIDMGNSRLKWAIEGDDPLRVHARNLDGDWDQRLAGDWQPLAPTRIVAVAVVPPEARDRLVALCLRLWSRPPEFFVATSAAGGVRNCYREPGELGADRWAALVGARSLADGAVLVVDCGTATTVDLLEGDGKFAGGAILPGQRIALQALGGGTAGARASGDREQKGQVGLHTRGTADALATGVVLGSVYAIEGFHRAWTTQLGSAPGLMLTGGGAAQLAGFLAVRHQVIPDLVLRGVARLAREPAEARA